MRVSIGLFALILGLTACEAPSTDGAVPTNTPTSVSTKAVTLGVAKAPEIKPPAPRPINHIIQVIPGKAKVGQPATALIEIDHGSRPPSLTSLMKPSMPS